MREELKAANKIMEILDEFDNNAQKRIVGHLQICLIADQATAAKNLEVAAEEPAGETA